MPTRRRLLALGGAATSCALAATLTRSGTGPRPYPGTGSPLVFSPLPGGTGLVIPAGNAPGLPAYRRAHVANPSVLVRERTVHLYVRVDDGSDRQATALFTRPVAGFDPARGWTDRGVVVGPGPAGSEHASGTWDPCACLWRGEVWLFWTCRPSGRLGAARSADGVTFATLPVAPGLARVATVGAAAVGETLYLAYNCRDARDGRYDAYIVATRDGAAWSAPDSFVGQEDDGTVLPRQPGHRMFGATGDPADLDGLNVEPLRLFVEDGVFYCVYGAGRHPSYDWPEAQCIARATDPFGPWEKRARPLALRGAAGSLEEGATWSGAYLRVGGRAHLFYEAVGTGTTAGAAASDDARDRAYAGFGTLAFSRVFASAAPADATLASWDPDADELPPGLYAVENLATGLDLGAGGDGPGAAAPTWLLTRDGRGFHRLARPRNRALVLGTAGRSRAEGAAAVATGLDEGDAAQQWFLAPVSVSAPGRGVYALVNRYSGQALGVTDRPRGDGATVRQSPWAGARRQQWRLTRVAPAS